MSKGKRLTNIAMGLCGSFVSRNNSLDRYWLIGKLRLLAMQQGRTVVTFDLLHDAMEPSSSDFACVSARYARLLAKLAEISGVPFTDITTATIQADFAPPPWPRMLYATADWGEEYVLTVTIRSEGRAAGVVRHSSYCRPHDPALERQSGRAHAA